MAKKDRSEVPETLSQEDQQRLIRWAKHHFPHYTTPREAEANYPKLAAIVGACLDWHGGHGNPGGWTDWRRCCQVWIRKEHEGKQKRNVERPQEPRVESRSDLVLLSDVIQLRRKV